MYAEFIFEKLSTYCQFPRIAKNVDSSMICPIESLTFLQNFTFISWKLYEFINADFTFVS